MERRYPLRPWVGVGVVLLRGDEVLLIRRARPPALGEWSLPGGAQHLGETAEAAARRELAEETGLAVGKLQLVAHADAIHYDGGRVLYHYTILDFGGCWENGEPIAHGDAAEARFVKQTAVSHYGVNATIGAVIEKAFALYAKLEEASVLF